jgi:hypothetical protein
VAFVRFFNKHFTRKPWLALLNIQIFAKMLGVDCSAQAIT